MAKNPYLKFYLGDYIKDTRILPLNVRGAWTDLILFMWDNDPKGEISGTIEDFSRLMCCSVEEAILVIQTLKQKKIFGWEEVGEGVLRIFSRKQKNMLKLSETRSKVGELGGNPKLLQPKEEILLNQKDNLNPEYEYIDFKRIGICPEMVKIFKVVYPKYAQDEQLDYPACLQIAYKIGKSKEWPREAVLNGKMSEILKIWRYMVDFSASDTWYSSRSISDFNKEYQRLVQKITNKKEKKDFKQQSDAPPLKKIN